MFTDRGNSARATTQKNLPCAGAGESLVREEPRYALPVVALRRLLAAMCREPNESGFIFAAKYTPVRGRRPQRLLAELDKRQRTTGRVAGADEVRDCGDFAAAFSRKH